MRRTRTRRKNRSPRPRRAAAKRNPARKRRRPNRHTPKRDSKGRFLKAGGARRNPARKRVRKNPRKGMRRAGQPRGARLAYDALGRKKPVRRRRRRSNARRHNPGAAKAFMDQLRGAGQIAAVLLPVRALINAVGNWKMKDKAGVEVPLHQRIGPLADVAMSGVALWAIPWFVLKGSGALGKFKQAGTVALQANLVLSAVNLLTFYARRDWKAENPPLVSGAEGYPVWTDYLTPIEPVARPAEGWYGLGAMDYIEPAGVTPYGTLGSPQMVFDASAGRFVSMGA